MTFQLGHGIVYPSRARGSSVPRGHELVYPAWARPVYPAWALGLSISLGHELVCPSWARARLSRLACGSSSREACGSSDLRASGSSRPRSPTPCPLLSGTRHAGIRPGPVPNRPEPCHLPIAWARDVSVAVPTLAPRVLGTRLCAARVGLGGLCFAEALPAASLRLCLAEAV